MSAIALV